MFCNHNVNWLSSRCSPDLWLLKCASHLYCDQMQAISFTLPVPSLCWQAVGCCCFRLSSGAIWCSSLTMTHHPCCDPLATPNMLRVNSRLLDWKFTLEFLLMKDYFDAYLVSLKMKSSISFFTQSLSATTPKVDRHLRVLILQFLNFSRYKIFMTSQWIKNVRFVRFVMRYGFCTKFKRFQQYPKNRDSQIQFHLAASRQLVG